HRPKLLAAALTLLSAYCQDGRKNLGLKAWGTYEHWSDLVRNAVVWADMADPGEARQHIANADSRLVALLKNLQKLLEDLGDGKRGLTAGKITDAVRTPLHSKAPQRREVRTILEEMLPKFDAPSLGYLLRTQHRRNIGGLFIDSVDSGSKTRRWRV